MEDRERRREEEEMAGRRGGSAEGYVGHPAMAGVAERMLAVPRVHWGPVFAGLLIALAVTFLFTGLGVGVGLGVRGIGYWLVGFGALGLFVGSMLAARVARADLAQAILHGVVIWALVMLFHVLAFGGFGGAVVANTLGRVAGTPGAMAASYAASSFGWWFFWGFLVMLAGAVLGSIVGMNPHLEHEEPVAPGH